MFRARQTLHLKNSSLRLRICRTSQLTTLTWSRFCLERTRHLFSRAVPKLRKWTLCGVSRARLASRAQRKQAVSSCFFSYFWQTAEKACSEIRSALCLCQYLCACCPPHFSSRREMGTGTWHIFLTTNSAPGGAARRQVQARKTCPKILLYCRPGVHFLRPRTSSGMLRCSKSLHRPRQVRRMSEEAVT